MKNIEGNRVPSVRFRTRQESEWVDRTSEDIFSGRNVIVFSLPGAFTPTCSSSHVPRFNQLAPVFRQHGIDEIVCVSVNDAFVMNEWKAAQDAERLTFLPDGNGEFTEKMGMLVRKDDLGFGERSWRYSMLVRDGVIEKMFIEPDEPGDPYGVSDADTMLSYVAPQAVPPPSIVVFSRPGCPHCARAKALLTSEGLEFEELVLNRDFTDATLRAVSQELTFPQIFVDGSRIGGADDLQAWAAGNKAA